MPNPFLEELIEKYTLSDEQHKNILTAKIIPRFLEPATRAVRPRLITKT